MNPYCAPSMLLSLGYNTVNQSDKPPSTQMQGMVGGGRHKQAGNHNIGSVRTFSLTGGNNPTQFSLGKKATYCLVQLKYLREDFSFRYCQNQVLKTKLQLIPTSLHLLTLFPAVWLHQLVSYFYIVDLQLYSPWLKSVFFHQRTQQQQTNKIPKQPNLKMGKGPEQTTLQRQYPHGQQICEKMFNITNQCKSKPQRDITSHLFRWISSKSQKMTCW